MYYLRFYLALNIVLTFNTGVLFAQCATKVSSKQIRAYQVVLDMNLTMTSFDGYVHKLGDTLFIYANDSSFVYNRVRKTHYRTNGIEDSVIVRSNYFYIKKGQKEGVFCEPDSNRITTYALDSFLMYHFSMHPEVVPEKATRLLPNPTHTSLGLEIKFVAVDKEKAKIFDTSLIQLLPKEKKHSDYPFSLSENVNKHYPNYHVQKVSLVPRVPDDPVIRANSAWGNTEFYIQEVANFIISDEIKDVLSNGLESMVFKNIKSSNKR
jgi:hypothetical protein